MNDTLDNIYGTDPTARWQDPTLPDGQDPTLSMAQGTPAGLPPELTADLPMPPAAQASAPASTMMQPDTNGINPKIIPWLGVLGALEAVGVAPQGSTYNTFGAYQNSYTQALQRRWQQYIAQQKAQLEQQKAADANRWHNLDLTERTQYHEGLYKAAQDRLEQGDWNSVEGWYRYASTQYGDKDPRTQTLGAALAKHYTSVLPTLAGAMGALSQGPAPEVPQPALPTPPPAQDGTLPMQQLSTAAGNIAGRAQTVARNDARSLQGQMGPPSPMPQDLPMPTAPVAPATVTPSPIQQVQERLAALIQQGPPHDYSGGAAHDAELKAYSSEIQSLGQMMDSLKAAETFQSDVAVKNMAPAEHAQDYQIARNQELRRQTEFPLDLKTKQGQIAKQAVDTWILTNQTIPRNAAEYQHLKQMIQHQGQVNANYGPDEQMNRERIWQQMQNGQGSNIATGANRLIAVAADSLMGANIGPLGCAKTVSLALNKAGIPISDLSARSLESKIQGLGKSRVVVVTNPLDFQPGDIIFGDTGNAQHPVHVMMMNSRGQVVGDPGTQTDGVVRVQDASHMPNLRAYRINPEGGTKGAATQTAAAKLAAYQKASGLDPMTAKQYISLNVATGPQARDSFRWWRDNAGGSADSEKTEEQPLFVGKLSADGTPTGSYRINPDNPNYGAFMADQNRWRNGQYRWVNGAKVDAKTGKTVPMGAPLKGSPNRNAGGPATGPTYRAAGITPSKAPAKAPAAPRSRRIVKDHG